MQQNMTFQKGLSNYMSLESRSHSMSGIKANTGTCSSDNNDIAVTNTDDRTTTLTLDNIHKCSTYTLRQELERRGISLQNEDCDDVTRNHGVLVNHNVLLQKMVQILYQEKEVEEKKNSQNESNQDNHMKGRTEAIKEQLYRKKMERKKDAIERSKQRQMTKEYFIKKKIANEEGMKKSIDKETTIFEECEDAQNSCNSYEDERRESNSGMSFAESNNPFALKFVPKIGGRFM